MTYLFKCPHCLHEFTVTLDKPNDKLLKTLLNHCGTECKVYVGNQEVKFN